MSSQFKEKDLIAIKFASGEEILAKFTSENETHIGVDSALTLMQGPQGLAMGTFFSTADPNKTMHLLKSSIISVADMNPKLHDQYNNVFNKIKTTPKPSIIT